MGIEKGLGEEFPQHLCKMCGQCCKAITTPYTHEELKELAAQGQEEARVFVEIFRKYPDVVDVPQLCEMLGGSRPVSKKTAYRMLNAGKIKAFRIGRSYRIPKVNVIRFLQNETPEDCNTVNATIDSVE